MLDRIATRSTSEHGDGDVEPTLWEGRIAEPPDADGYVQAVIPGFHPDLRSIPCPFMPRGAAVPSRGDRCLVAISDQAAPWVIAWVPAP